MSNTIRSKSFRKDKRESKINKLNGRVIRKSYNRQKEKKVQED